ncbi:MAG: hypothetical protein V2I27_01320 [Erythrobacter sp.]|jgi:hypothetical protein|nr:hypothetical protein [Erythrobacter sp.]
MTAPARVNEILDSSRIRGMIHFTDTIGEEEKRRIGDFVADQAERIKSGMNDIEDDEDAGYFLAVKYVETKANWIQMNLQLNYQTVLRGDKDEVLFNKAAAVAGFLGQIEPLISTDDLKMINGLLLEGMRS